MELRKAFNVKLVLSNEYHNVQSHFDLSNFDLSNYFDLSNLGLPPTLLHRAPQKNFDLSNNFDVSNFSLMTADLLRSKFDCTVQWSGPYDDSDLGKQFDGSKFKLESHEVA